MANKGGRLVLSRGLHEIVYLRVAGVEIAVEVSDIPSKHRVALMFTAPADVEIVRAELDPKRVNQPEAGRRRGEAGESVVVRAPVVGNLRGEVAADSGVAVMTTLPPGWLPIVGGPWDGGAYYLPDDFRAGTWLVPRGGVDGTHCYRVSGDGRRVEWSRMPQVAGEERGQ